MGRGRIASVCGVYAPVDPAARIVSPPINPPACGVGTPIESAACGPRTPGRSTSDISPATTSISARCSRSAVDSAARASRTSTNVPAGGASPPVYTAASIFSSILCVPACVSHVLLDTGILSLAGVLRQ